MPQGKICNDCEGKTSNLSEVRDDFYECKEKQIAFNNKLLGGLGVATFVFSLFATIGIISYKGISTDVHAAESNNNQISKDVAVIQNDVSTIKDHLSKLDKNQEKLQETLQLILQEIK